MFSQRCFVCGKDTVFSSPVGNPREATCAECQASKRTSDVAQALVATFAEPGANALSLVDVQPRLRTLRIFEARAAGPLHRHLAGLPGYVCSEVLDEVQPRLNYPDNTFDLMLAEDILEHVPDPWQACREIRRVLKPNGRLVFTVPYHPEHLTQTRACLTATGVHHLLPPVHHEDPPRQEDPLVFTDFGADLVVRLEEIGFVTHIHELGTWYRPQEVTWLGAGGDFLQPVQEQDQQPGAFRYNSQVFVSTNLKMPFTGERFTPEIRGEIAYEHLHRYRATQELVVGKVVLDIACGEGYGTILLAHKAARVIGVDVSEETVRHASNRYRREANVEFRVGDCGQIPCPDGAVDVVVSFETIEHLADHDTFLREIKRVLRPDGCLVLSSPNKADYTDAAKFHNPFHQRELYEHELVELLRRHFGSLQLFGQRMTFCSYLWPLGDAGEPFRHLGPEGGNQPPFAPRYYLAVCSDRLPARLLGGSLFTEGNDPIYQEVQARAARLRHLEGEIARRDAALDELRRRLAEVTSAPPLPSEPDPGKRVAPAATGTPGTPAPEVVSIVIPVFNQRSLTEKCLEALYRNTPRDEGWEVIVVDNGSEADMRVFLAGAKKKYPSLRVLTNGKNLGFARACNQGAAAAVGKDVLFLNNDTEVHPGWLRPLVEILRRDARVGAVGAKLLYPDGTIQHAGIIFANHQGYTHPNPLEIKMVYLRCPADQAEANQTCLYPAVSGACLLMRKATFTSVGGFDEAYWNGCEDLDLCFKLLQRGLLVVYEPQSVITHHEHGSGRERFRKNKENIRLWRDRWLGKVPAEAVFGVYSQAGKFIPQRPPQPYTAPQPVR